MMRIENLDFAKFDGLFEDAAVGRIVKAAAVVAKKTRENLKRQIGTGKNTGFKRPVYKTGPYAGQRWTGREVGNLMKSVRVVRKRGAGGRVLFGRKDVRVYAGNYLAYYAAAFEFTRPFMRTAVAQASDEIRSILGDK